jgi:hypothetical protein
MRLINASLAKEDLPNLILHRVRHLGAAFGHLHGCPPDRGIEDHPAAGFVDREPQVGQVACSPGRVPADVSRRTVRSVLPLATIRPSGEQRTTVTLYQIDPVCPGVALLVS